MSSNIAGSPAGGLRPPQVRLLAGSEGDILSPLSQAIGRYVGCTSQAREAECATAPPKAGEVPDLEDSSPA